MFIICGIIIILTSSAFKDNVLSIFNSGHRRDCDKFAFGEFQIGIQNCATNYFLGIQDCKRRYISSIN